MPAARPTASAGTPGSVPPPAARVCLSDGPDLVILPQGSGLATASSTTTARGACATASAGRCASRALKQNSESCRRPRRVEPVRLPAPAGDARSCRQDSRNGRRPSVLIFSCSARLCYGVLITKKICSCWTSIRKKADSGVPEVLTFYICIVQRAVPANIMWFAPGLNETIGLHPSA